MSQDQDIEKYVLPTIENVLVDVNSDTIVSPKDLTPLEKIKLIASSIGVELKDPNPNCSVNGCYGRGYTGVMSDTKQPIPCKCIYKNKEDFFNQNRTNLSRDQRRRFKKEVEKLAKKLAHEKLKADLENIANNSNSEE